MNPVGRVTQLQNKTKNPVSNNQDPDKIGYEIWEK